ncbi:MAG: HIT family protein [bacterium]
MRKLWAPWRTIYIDQPSCKRNECFICLKLKENNDEKNFILKRTNYSVALLNTYPYTSGHIMVAPARHIDSPLLLTREELLDKEELVNMCIEALVRAFKPNGFNVGVNLGEVAGAGLIGHYHIHIVPRWKGDTNFMPVIGEVKVINQALEETYKRLKTIFDTR